MTDRSSYVCEAEAAPEDASPLPKAQSTLTGTTFINLVMVLARRRRLIATVTGAGMAAGIAASLLMPVRYTATAMIMTPRETTSLASLLVNQMSVSGGGGLAALTDGPLGMRNPNDLYIGLLTSRPIEDSIIRQFGLVHLYHAQDMTAARTVLMDNTQIASEKGGLISISVTDGDKRRAAELANGYTDQLRALTQSLATTEASQRQTFYEAQLKSTKESLVIAETDFERIQQRRGIIQPNAQELAMINGLAALRAQMSAKEIEVQALRSYSTDRSPELQLAENELSSLRTEIARLGGHNHSSEPSSLGIGDIPAASLDYLSAEHEVQYRQALLDLLVKLYDAARIDEAKQAAVIEVVAPAIEPDRRSSPKRTPITLLAALVGLATSCFLVLLEAASAALQADPHAAQRLRALKKAFTS